MIKAFHGSPYLFDRFSLDCAGDGTGIKFGFGIYLTEVEKSAVHYSQPRKVDIAPEHFLYTVQIPDLTADNHLVSAKPVVQAIIDRTEKKLGIQVPDKVKSAGKEFRKWLGCQTVGSLKAGLAEEKAAAQFLDSIGVICNVWPTAQTNPDGPRNIAVFNEANVTITRVERIGIERKADKWVLVSRQEIGK